MQRTTVALLTTTKHTRSTQSHTGLLQDSQSRGPKKQTRLMAENLGERFECITTVLNNECLSRCCGETSGKCNVMKGLIWLTVGGPSPSRWGRQLVTSYPVRKQREMDAVAQLLSPFTQPRTPVCGLVLPTVRLTPLIVFLPQLTCLETPPQGRAAVCLSVSRVILCHIQLMIRDHKVHWLPSCFLRTGRTKNWKNSS